MESLKGQLLISGGGLFDPNFRHTVVLVGEHNTEGALGVVLNRPLELSVREGIPALADLVGADERLFQGGPVQPDQPVLLAEFAHPGLSDLPVFGAIGFLIGAVSSEVREEVLRARVFAGYAGWGPGQLEDELKEGAWILETATEDDVFNRTPDTLWRQVLERKGPRYAGLARIPFDPSMN